MLAKGNEYLQEAAESIYIANADDIVRQQCRAREEAERYERTMKRDMQRLKEDNEQLKADNEQLKADNTLLKKDISELQTNMALIMEKLQEIRKIKELFIGFEPIN